MKSLLYREMYLGRKRYIIMGGMALMISVVGILVRLSMLYGNMAHLDTETFKSVDNATFYFFSLIPFVIMLSSVFATVEVICDDYKFKWNVYCRSTHMTCMSWVMIKYLMVIMLSVFSCVNGMLYCVLLSHIAKIKMPLSIFKYYLLILGVFLIMNGIAMALAYKYKNINNVVVRIVGAVIVMGVAGYVILFKKLETFSERHPEIPAEMSVMVFIKKLMNKINFNNITTCILCLIVIGIIIFTIYLSVKYFETSEER